jgi:hypothetical protein
MPMSTVGEGLKRRRGTIVIEVVRPADSSRPAPRNLGLFQGACTSTR